MTEVENTTYSGVGKSTEYAVFDDYATFTHDVFGQVIYTNEIFIYIDGKDVHFDNICRYLDEQHNDQFASELEDKQLLEYVQDQYTAYVGVQK